MPARPRARDASRDLLPAIAELGATASSLQAFREGILRILGEVVPFDAAAMHALSPRVPLDSAVFENLDPARFAATVPSWDELAVELEPLRQLANQNGGVASDLEAFASGTRGRRRFDALARGLGVRSLVIVHLTVRGAVRAAVLLFQIRREALSERELELLRAVAPAVAIGDALQASLDELPRAALPVRMECRDQRLTRRQQEIVEHVALGHTNEAIARALGVSPNTLRNHLAEVFRRLGASNRADVVRLAVLRPG